MRAPQLRLILTCPEGRQDAFPYSCERAAPAELSSIVETCTLFHLGFDTFGKHLENMAERLLEDG